MTLVERIGQLLLSQLMKPETMVTAIGNTSHVLYEDMLDSKILHDIESKDKVGI